MANYRGHTLGGAVSGAVVGSVYLGMQRGQIDVGVALTEQWQLFAGLIIVGVLFGLFPDVDTNSKAQNLFFGTAFIVDILLIVSGYFAAAALLGLLAMTPILSHHRGWTHSKLAALLVPLPILIIPYLSSGEFQETGILIYASSVVGYLSHLLLDGLIWKRIRLRGSWR